MNGTSIKWKRLRRILEGICKREVQITLTTHTFATPGEGEVSMSAATFNEDKVEFLLNADEIKSRYMVQKALAHEAAHVVLGNGLHDEAFLKQWDALLKVIKDQYKEVRGTEE